MEVTLLLWLETNWGTAILYAPQYYGLLIKLLVKKLPDLGYSVKGIGIR